MDALNEVAVADIPRALHAKVMALLDLIPIEPAADMAS
jgi:hypothetical protein